jgi:hypothetical protein
MAAHRRLAEEGVGPRRSRLDHRAAASASRGRRKGLLLRRLLVGGNGGSILPLPTPLPRRRGLHLRMVRVVPTPEPLGTEPEGVSGLDDLGGWYPSTDRRPLAGSALNREHSREILETLLHREQT